MNRNLLKLTALLLMLVPTALQARKQITVTSPDKTVAAHIDIDQQITYSITADGREVLAASPIAMTLTDGTVWGQQPRLKSQKQEAVSQVVRTSLYRSAEMADAYTQLTLQFNGDWALEFRAYNDGIAYRFVSSRKKAFCVKNETVSYRFATDAVATVPFVHTGKDGDLESQYPNSFENAYTTAPLSQLNKHRLAFVPVVVETESGVKLGITESNLNDYPGLFLTSADGQNSLTGRFAPAVKRTEQGGHNNLQQIVKEREQYIARVTAPRAFPWRIAIVGKTDAQLAASNLSYLLGEPSRVADTSWIRPGKVAWDWWNDWNISGVDFQSGVNTATYKHYIDFASEKGIEYVILDEGWAVSGAADLMQVVDDIDLEEIIRYATEKNVGIILWAGYYAFDRDMENVCRHYSEMGVKGFKVDFMDRDDQYMTAFEHRAAKMCAKYKLLLDLHGSYKPAGMNRTWPNVVNFEGVNGLEQMKWSPDTLDQVKYDCLLPFTRQLAGPMDYTQGAMRNAARGSYHPCNSEPMSQGTRCRQLALYMIFDSPLTMLCDSPDNYRSNPECTDFIAGVPTVWDETRVLAAKMGEYVVMARRKGQTWYVGGITDWKARDLTLNCGFVGTEGVKATLFSDGANAHRKGSDYKKETLTLSPSTQLKVHLAPGGGFALKVEK